MNACSLLAPLFLALAPLRQGDEAAVLRRIPTPSVAQPVAPIFAQLEDGGTSLHRLPLPPHLVVAGPGMSVIESNDGSIEFVAARSGHAVVQVASLSVASGPFEARVLELW